MIPLSCLLTIVEMIIIVRVVLMNIIVTFKVGFWLQDLLQCMRICLWNSFTLARLQDSLKDVLEISFKAPSRKPYRNGSFHTHPRPVLVVYC